MYQWNQTDRNPFFHIRTVDFLRGYGQPYLQHGPLLTTKNMRKNPNMARSFVT